MPGLNSMRIEVRKWWISLAPTQRLEWQNLKGEMKEGNQAFHENHRLSSSLMPANALSNIFAGRQS